jgi:hypothetical protein
MENSYIIEKGTHYSSGKKSQPMVLWLSILLMGMLWTIFFTIPNGLFPVVMMGVALIFIVNYTNERKEVRHVQMKVTFQNGCLYHMDPPENADINKLFGIGFGNHLKYSGRFGWNCIDGEISIYGYVRNEGIMEWGYIMSCAPNETLHMAIRTEDDYYHFSVYRTNGEIFRLKNGRKRNRIYDLLPYRLYPYFGGTSVATHDMTIRMEKL